MAKIKIQTTRSNKHTAMMIIGGVFLVAVLCFGALAGIKMANKDEKAVIEESDINTANTENEQKQSTPESDIDENYTTPGNEAKAKNDELEKRQHQQVERNESGLKKANVLLHDPYVVGQKTVISSTITNIVETEGTCSYIFTKDTQSVTKITSVLPNAKNTVCEAVVLEKGSLSSGEWKVRLEYKSNLSEGVSETQTFTIQ
ncbi:hypothetical protein IJV57_01655 [Candidatus Saccharibacteria bacterium]|nr:hypothetical protein [Candidatus Saccharibacteria bacterium]